MDYLKKNPLSLLPIMMALAGIIGGWYLLKADAATSKIVAGELRKDVDVLKLKDAQNDIRNTFWLDEFGKINAKLDRIDRRLERVIK